MKSVSCFSAANQFDLVQSWDKVSLLWDGYLYVGNDGLDLSSPLHPAQPLLRDPTSKQVEDLHLSIHASPLAHLKEPHLV